MKPTIPLLFFTVVILAGCWDDGGKKQATPPPAAAAAMVPEVDVITVTPGTATLTRELPGRLEAYRIAQVRARVEGIVERRLFTEGSDVKVGSTLFRIDPRNYKATFDSAQADLAVARVTLERYRPLLDIKAISRQEVDLAEAKVKQAEVAVTRARIDLENTTVPAPIEGRIGRALVTEGALVGKGEATHLATIEQIDSVYVNFTQPGADIVRLRQAVQSGVYKEATRAQVELIQEDGSLYPEAGQLLFSNLAVDPTTGSVTLRALFPNPRHELLPGAFVRIRFPEATAEKVMRVPQRAVQSTPMGQSVLVVDGSGKVTSRVVKTGAMSGSDFIITEGLQGGEEVIVNGLQKVQPGAMVKAVPWVNTTSDDKK